MAQLLVYLSLYSALTNALVPPQPLLTCLSVRTAELPCPMDSHIFQGLVTKSCTTYNTFSSTLSTSEHMPLLADESGPHILLAATIAIPLLAIAKFMYSSYVVPEAAKQLETETKDLAPKLWHEVKGELEDGEILEQRPDLMRELFTKIQPYLLKELAEQMQEELGADKEDLALSDPRDMGTGKDKPENER